MTTLPTTGPACRSRHRLHRRFVDQLRKHRGGDHGFGTVEWVLIAFFVAGMAIVLGVLLYNAVETKGEDVSDCIAGSVGCEAP